MSLAQITEKIEQDARAEAQKILDRAKEQEAEVKSASDAEVRKLEETAQGRFDRERPEIFKRRDIVARLDVNKLRLGAQRRLIQDVFDGALEKLKSLDKNGYAAFCKALLKKAAQEGQGELVLAKKEKYLDKAWLDKFNAENGTNISLSEERGDFSGGFVLNNGRIDINCSWEMLMQAAQEKLETEVVKRLFPS
jgi:V/A-type H+-transporting ATPase subunit E